MTEPPAPDPSDGTDIRPLLDLEPLDENLFRNRVNEVNFAGSLFGGQVLAQALHAAVRTVEARPPHSLHGYFLRPGAADRLVIYQVERTRDGGSFSTRRVTAIQRGVAIFHLEASFHAVEAGLTHEVGPAAIPAKPEDVATMAELAERYADEAPARMIKRMSGAHRMVESRPIDPKRQFVDVDPNKPGGQTWMRIPSAKGLSPELHACALAYASDFWLAGAARMAHYPGSDTTSYMIASLDHAMWFHTPDQRADDWRLYEVDSPWSGAGRGLCRGAIYDREMRLAASTAQEILLRKRRPPS